MMKTKICIFGAGGFGREIYYGFQNFFSLLEIPKTNIYFTDDNLDTINWDLKSLNVLLPKDISFKDHHMIIGLGNPTLREEIVNRLPVDAYYMTLIHENALNLDNDNSIGEGAIITAGSILTTNIKIGKHCHINLNTTIGHDCIIGDYFTTAPGVHISGDCVIGNKVYFGTNSAVKNGITICDDVTIGMGAVVTKNISESGVYIGNPLRKL